MRWYCSSGSSISPCGTTCPRWPTRTPAIPRIADGDTFTLLVGRERLRVRLAEIDTPEEGQPYGTRARQVLSDLIYRKTVRVAVVDQDRCV
jgi:endonuclease YncB( thermonuclease family)